MDDNRSWAVKVADRRAAGLDTSLDSLLEMARSHVMSVDEYLAQRRSWVIGELMLEYPELTREDAEKRVKIAELGLMYGRPE